MGISQAAIRYLLTIYELSDDGAAVRSVDISRRLEVTPASVVHMLGVLSAEGLAEKRYYGKVRLTGHPGGQPPLYRLRPAEGLFYRISGGGQRDGPGRRRQLPVLPVGAQSGPNRGEGPGGAGLHRLNTHRERPPERDRRALVLCAWHWTPFV